MALQINLCETEVYENVLATYVLTDNDESEVQACTRSVSWLICFARTSKKRGEMLPF